MRQGAVNEIVPADKLLARAREIAEGLAKLPSLTTKYTRIAMSQKLRRIIDEGVTLGLALEGISAADGREQSERAPKQGFGDLENDKTTGSAAVSSADRENVASAAL
jgi:enoyl-CoA hydratase/carnithine racemase